MKNIDVGVFQMNPQIGDLEGNRKKITEAIEESVNSGVDLLVTPEMSLIGYPPMDILRRGTMYEKQAEEIDILKEQTKNTELYVVVGFCRRDKNGIYNSALVLNNGEIVTKYDKRLLPTYDVFDGHRYFKTGNQPKYFKINDTKIGISICEDAWSDVDVMNMKVHSTNPFDDFSQDTDIIINMSASPYRIGKKHARLEQFHSHAVETETTVILCNQVGGNDELVFDGNSVAVNQYGESYGMKSFSESLTVIKSLETDKSELYSTNQTEEIKNAIIMGIRDYFSKTGFSDAIIGMSGGVDSSVATALTVEALGKDNVLGVTLPSEITSSENIRDAERVANNFDIDFTEVPISTPVSDIKEDVEEFSDYSLNSIAEENIQARIRGDILMTLANSTNSLVITPDNKSESAIGYCTLYGDTVGAIAPLADCYKKYVYDIADSYNQIPERVIQKPPTAELKEDQKDSDEMPEYEALDSILDQYIENNVKPDDIDLSNEDIDINQVISNIHRSEFKRNQSPIPIRITKKDFGRGWRYPISGDYDFLD